MTKYESLTTYLNSCKTDCIKLTYTQMEEILDFSLPLSSHKYKVWWSNDDKMHSQCKGWGEAGYMVKDVVLGESVVFCKK